MNFIAAPVDSGGSQDDENGKWTHLVQNLDLSRV